MSTVNNGCKEGYEGKCGVHEYAEKFCRRCGQDFCFDCCKATNVHEGGKHNPDFMECPHCGHDYYDPMLMNPNTGSVACKSDWMSEFEVMSSESWGGEKFDDAGLVEVFKNDNGEWQEV